MSHLCEYNEYPLSKDVDVVLWQDCRAYYNQAALVEVDEFVIVNSEVHEEFDEYKKNTIGKGYSYLKVNELIEFYLLQNDHLSGNVKTLYNKAYLKLSGSDIDELCDWLLNLRKSYEQEGVKVFSTGNYC